MNRKKLRKVRKLLAAMRRSPQNARKIERLASHLGREQVKRGKEPVWVNPHFAVFPVAIPHHSGKDLPIGTKNSILDQLEEDILAWDEYLPEGDDG